MTSPEIAGELRDRSLVRLRRLTAAVALSAAGLAVVLSIVAAWTNPGQSSGGSTSNTGSDPTQANNSDLQVSQDGKDGQDDQAPFAGFVGSGSSVPVAVTGGSHH